MNNMVRNMIMLGLVLLLFSCVKQDTLQILAPNGQVVSESMEQLETAFANQFNVIPEDFAINNIKFHDVDEGFSAVVSIYDNGNDLGMDVGFRSHHYWKYQSEESGTTLELRGLTTPNSFSWFCVCNWQPPIDDLHAIPPKDNQCPLTGDASDEAGKNIKCGSTEECEVCTKYEDGVW